MKIQFRDLKTSDVPFVFSTYLKSNYYSKENTSTLRKKLWFEAHHARLEKLLWTTKIVIACLDEDEDTILGYSLIDSGNKHFCYVKQDFRSKGIDLKNRLLKQLEINNV